MVRAESKRDEKGVGYRGCPLEGCSVLPEKPQVKYAFLFESTDNFSIEAPSTPSAFPEVALACNGKSIPARGG